MRLYGSLENRMLENQNFSKGEIKEGMLCTVFYYTDSHVYEVVKVEKQNHIFIRRMKAIRVDNNGMSEMQKYKFESDFNRKIIELKFSYKHWKQVITDKFTNAKRLENINISFGIAKEYYDYSF